MLRGDVREHVVCTQSFNDNDNEDSTSFTHEDASFDITVFLFKKGMSYLFGVIIKVSPCISFI